jgi:hypothetical protein
MRAMHIGRLAASAVLVASFAAACEDDDTPDDDLEVDVDGTGGELDVDVTDPLLGGTGG